MTKKESKPNAEALKVLRGLFDRMTQMELTNNYDLPACWVRLRQEIGLTIGVIVPKSEETSEDGPGTEN